MTDLLAQISQELQQLPKLREDIHNLEDKVKKLQEEKAKLELSLNKSAVDYEAKVKEVDQLQCEQVVHQSIIGKLSAEVETLYKLYDTVLVRLDFGEDVCQAGSSEHLLGPNYRY